MKIYFATEMDSKNKEISLNNIAATRRLLSYFYIRAFSTQQLEQYNKEGTFKKQRVAR